MIKDFTFKTYILKLIIRLGIFCLVLFAYIVPDIDLYTEIMRPLYLGIAPGHVIWLILMLMMVRHLIPPKFFTMALLKSRPEKFRPAEYDELELHRYVHDMNIRAWTVMLVWLILNAFVGFLYLFHFIGKSELLLISTFYFISDYICILFFCPFQTVIMKNRCCVNCRIYDWGHFMMFTPLLFIENFYCWSLFFMALIVMIAWELKYAIHPERFWYGSNTSIRCENCNDRTCRMKKGLARMVTGTKKG